MLKYLLLVYVDPGASMDEIMHIFLQLLTQLGEAQVRALFEGNDEYAEISTGADATAAEFVPEVSDEEVDGQAGNSDPRPFKCIACKVAFRFQVMCEIKLSLLWSLSLSPYLESYSHYPRLVAQLVTALSTGFKS